MDSLSQRSTTASFEQVGRQGPLCAVVVLNWMRPSDTIACCESVLASDYQHLAVVVCDNGSSDDSYHMMKTAFAALGEVQSGDDEEFGVMIERRGRLVPLVLLNTGANLGYAGGNNIGIRTALRLGAEYVVILNNDCTVEPAALSHLTRVAEGDPGVGLMGALVCDERNPHTIQLLGGGYFNPWLCRVRSRAEGLSTEALAVHSRHSEPPLDYISGACVLVRRRALDTVGLMREDLFLYFEELDWSMRMQRGGWRLGVAPEARVYHRSLAADHARRINANYYYTRNGLHLVRQYFPLALPTAVGASLLRAALLGLRGRVAEARAVAAGVLAFGGSRRGPRAMGLPNQGAPSQ